MNECLNKKYDERICYLEMDVYVVKTMWCGEDYIEIYDSSTTELVTRILEGEPFDPSLDILIEPKYEVVCEHCFNGVIDGDETGVDCGGSCEPCVEEIYSFTWFDRLMRVAGF